MKVILPIVLAMLPHAVWADDRLLQVQTLLTKWQLYDGPTDGTLNPETVESLEAFFDHRGKEFDGTFDDEEYREVLGQTDFSLPKAEGLELCQKDGFPSSDTYQLNPERSDEFSVRLRKGDYDRRDFRGDKNFYVEGTQNLSRQNATLQSCEWLEPGRTHVVEFDTKISHASIGTFFSIRSESPDGAIEFQIFPGSVRVGSGSSTPSAAYRGEVLDEWLKFRVEFTPEVGAPLSYRVFVNDELGLEADAVRANFAFTDKGALLVFGSDRGKSTLEATAAFRDIRLK